MKTVVIADDEPIIRMDLAEQLTGLGFRVVASVADGFDAVEYCRKHHPDLALLDIKMPMFDGLSAAETIVREETTECIVLLTAFNDREFWERAKDIGVSGYLVKPISEKTLLPAIEIAMEQSRRNRETQKEIRKLREQLQAGKTIEQAKRIIAERDGISESEAYAQMRRMSMNRKTSISEIASLLLASNPETELTAQAKQILMKQMSVNEDTAYRRLREFAGRRGISIVEAARAVIRENKLPGGKRL